MYIQSFKDDVEISRDVYSIQNSLGTMQKYLAKPSIDPSTRAHSTVALNHAQIWTSININHISWLNYNHCRTLSHTNGESIIAAVSETEVRINQTSETCKDSVYGDRGTSHGVAPRKFIPVSVNKNHRRASTYLRRA